MPVAERLRALAGSDPSTDVDEALTEVRRRARARVRRRAAACSLAAVLLVAGLVAWLRPGDDGTTVTTADHAVEPIRLLPAEVPAGYRLAWVDVPPIVEPDVADVRDRWHDYAFGYQSEWAELQVNVYLDARVPTSDDRLTKEEVPYVLDGRPALRWDFEDDRRVLLQVGDAVIMVVVHPMQAPDSFVEDPRTPSFADVERFAASIRPVADSVWQSALSADVDVASSFGPKDGTPVVSGEGWRLLTGHSRPPAMTRYPGAWVEIDGTAGVTLGHDMATMGEMVTARLDSRQGVTIAWGVLPQDVSRIDLTFGDRMLHPDLHAAGDVKLFAVEVSDVENPEDGRFVAVADDGRSVGSGPLETD